MEDGSEKMSEDKMEFMDYIHVFECLSTGKRSRHLLDVLPRRLTLNPDYVGVKGREFKLFHEIRLVPFRELITKEWQELFTMKTNTVKMSRSEFLLGIRQRMENIIMANWDSKATHIHLHSSGFDSRILSCMIRNLFQKHGSDWLGHMAFVCSKWEGPSFRKIMEYEGWNQNQYLVVREKSKDEDVWAPIFLDFKNAWQRSQGDFTRARSIFVYLPEMASQELKFPLNNVQIWHTDGHGLVSQKNGAGMRDWFEMLYAGPSGGIRPEWEVISPYHNLDLLKFILQSPFSFDKPMRLQLIAIMDKRLVKIPNLNKLGHIPWRHSSFALEKALQDYRKSWYGRKIRPNAVWPEVKEYRYKNWRQINKMTSHWTIASFCDYLLASGYKIKVRKVIE